MLEQNGFYSEQKEVRFCPNCGVRLDNERKPKYCSNCGTALEPCREQRQMNIYVDKGLTDMVEPSALQVSPGVAAALNFVFIGLGQMLNGQPVKGVLMLFGGIGLGVLLSIFLGPATYIFAPVIWIVSAIDAYQCSAKLKQGIPIKKFTFFGDV